MFLSTLEAFPSGFHHLCNYLVIAEASTCISWAPTLSLQSLVFTLEWARSVIAHVDITATRQLHMLFPQGMPGNTRCWKDVPVLIFLYFSSKSEDSKTRQNCQVEKHCCFCKAFIHAADLILFSLIFCVYYNSLSPVSLNHFASTTPITINGL